MRTWVSVAVAVVLAITVVGLLAGWTTGPPIAGQVTSPPTPNSPGTSSARPRVPAAYTPRTELISTDPVSHPHAISERLRTAVDATPAGERIEISTYFLASERIYQALRRAFARGVEVRAIFAAGANGRKRQGVALGRLLNKDPTDGSWVVWSLGSARYAGGLMHQKSYRFSRVGAARWVTMVGSYNSSDASDRGSYAMMWQIVGDKRVYDTFARITRQQTAQRNLRDPFRAFAGPGWSAYFLPHPVERASADPVVERLRSIPARPSTTIRIAMHSMWGPRASYIADRLVAMRRGGARIVFLAGATVDPVVQRRLRAGGVVVDAGCFADGTFTHSKDMSATWLHAGRRVHWTWVGSDNWTTWSLSSDEAVIGVQSKQGFDAFTRAFERVRARRDAPHGPCVTLEN